MRRTVVLCVVVLSLAACTERGEKKHSAPKVAQRTDDQPTAVKKGTETKMPAVDYRAIAETMVGEQARVKEDDMVVISGGVDDAALMDELTVAAWKRGAHVVTFLDRPQLGERYFEEVPEKYDADASAFMLQIASITDVFINIGAGAPAVGKDIPPERAAKFAKSWRKVDDLLNKRGLRRLNFGNGLTPTEEMAKMFGVPRAELARAFWAALGTDAEELRETGNKVRQAVMAAKELRLSNPNGTALTMRVQKRQVRVTDGTISDEAIAKGGTAPIMWLPAGEAFWTPVPGTADGTLVVDRVPYEDSEILNFRATFEKGVMTKFSADPGEAFERWKKRHEVAPDGKNDFGFVDIGINPGISGKTAERIPNFVSAGMVTVGVGGNEWAGGDNHIGYVSLWHLPGSTLQLDEKPIVENGQLKL